MASTYTRRLAITNVVPANVDTVLFTAPPNQTSVIRDFVLTNPTASAALVNLYIRSGGLAAALLFSPIFAANQTTHVQLRQVLEVGDELRFVSSIAGVQVVVTGYALNP